MFPVRCGSWFGLEGRHEPSDGDINPGGAPMELYIGNTFYANNHSRTIEQTMEEITAFSRLPDYRQMIDPPPRDWSYLPPEPPPKNTPEFDLWKKHGYEFMHHQYQKAFDQLEKQRQKEYFAAVENYRRQSKLKQMFSSPPNWKDYAPKTEDVLKYLRENKSFTKDQKS